MTVTVAIINDNAYTVQVRDWQRAVEAVVNYHQIVSDVEISIAVQDDDAIKTLNQQFRNQHTPTDVLSFPSGEIDDLAELPEAFYLGDLAIAYPYASTQAKRHNHPLEASLILLVVHGVLHLLGYDHDNDESRAKMWQVQAHILDQLGISTTIVPALEGETHE